VLIRTIARSGIRNIARLSGENYFFDYSHEARAGEGRRERPFTLPGEADDADCCKKCVSHGMRDAGRLLRRGSIDLYDTTMQYHEAKRLGAICKGRRWTLRNCHRRFEMTGPIVAAVTRAIERGPGNTGSRLRKVRSRSTCRFRPNASTNSTPDLPPSARGPALDSGRMTMVERDGWDDAPWLIDDPACTRIGGRGAKGDRVQAAGGAGA